MKINFKNNLSIQTRLRQDDLELTDQLTFLYDRLCHIRQTLTGSQRNSTMDIPTVDVQTDSLLSDRYYAKPRSDSEPNILSDRQSFKAVIEDFQQWK